MRKLAMLTAGVLAAGAFAVAPTVAQSPTQTTLTVSSKVNNNKAGTKRNPQAVRLTVNTRWTTPDGLERPVITRALARFPKGAKWNGGNFPKCSQNTLNRQGLRGCPKSSLIGTGTGTAFADTVITRPKITIVNGGAKRVCLYTVLNNPARVQAPVPGVIRKKRGKFAYEVQFTVPRVLQVVAGVPIQLRDLTFRAGKTIGRGKKKRGIFETTFCPRNKQWPFEVETFYATGASAETPSGSSGVVADTMRCR